MMKDNILTIPDLLYFDNDWDNLQKYLKSKGDPPWKCRGDLNLSYSGIKTLGNLVSIGGHLNLFRSRLASLGNLVAVGDWLVLERSTIVSLGNLKYIGGNLDLDGTEITSFGNLKSIGGYLLLRNTPVSIKYTKEEIRKMINVKGDIYM